MSKFKKSKDYVRKDSVKKTFDRPRESFKSSRDSSQNFEKKTKSSGFEMYTAVCDSCGRKCDLPFKPTNNKPVYCRSCFRKEGSIPNNNSRDKFKEMIRSDANVRPNSSSEELDKINRKLDKIMKALNIN